MSNYPYEVWPVLNGEQTVYCVRLLDFREVEEGWGATAESALKDAEAKCVAWLQKRYSNYIQDLRSGLFEGKQKRHLAWIERPGVRSTNEFRAPIENSVDRMVVEFRPSDDYPTVPVQLDPQEVALQLAKAQARKRSKSNQKQSRVGRKLGQPNTDARSQILQTEARAVRKLTDAALGRMVGISKQYVWKVRSEPGYREEIGRIRDRKYAFKIVERLEMGAIAEPDGDGYLRRLSKFNEMSDALLKEWIFRWANRSNHKWPVKSMLDGKVYKNGDEYAEAICSKLDQSKSGGARIYPLDLFLTIDDAEDDGSKDVAELKQK